jgi:acyl-CoA thioester hydrolase
MLSASVDIRVRYKETDQMGVVYHANYFTWFEIARIELLDQMGCPYIDLEKKGYLLPVLTCSASFQSPAFFDDRLQVKVEIAKIPLVRIQASYEVRRGSELLVTGQTEHAFVSRAGRVVRPPEIFLNLAKKSFED